MYADCLSLSLAGIEQRGRAKIRRRVREIFSHVALISPSSQGNPLKFKWYYDHLDI